MKAAGLVVFVIGVSMLPVLEPGHFFTFAIAEPQRGSIVVFRNGVPPDTLKVKRVVGVPGDTLAVVGLRMPEKGHAGAVIPGGWFYLMGDNRRHSRDSRHFGFVHRRDIRGVLRHEGISGARNHVRKLPD